MASRGVGLRSNRVRIRTDWGSVSAFSMSYFLVRRALNCSFPHQLASTGDNSWWNDQEGGRWQRSGLRQRPCSKILSPLMTANQCQEKHHAISSVSDSLNALLCRNLLRSNREDLGVANPADPCRAPSGSYFDPSCLSTGPSVHLHQVTDRLT